MFKVIEALHVKIPNDLRGTAGAGPDALATTS